MNSLAWSQVGGHSVIPKSVHTSRIQENFKEVELQDDEFAAIEAIGQQPRRYNIPWIASMLYATIASVSGVTMKIFTNPAIHTDKPRWPIDVFGDPAEKEAPHKVILGA